MAFASADGRKIYFNRNNLLNADFDKLRASVDVRYVEEAADKGPQASSVRVESKLHVV
jgi:cold shock CspA family protein